MFLPPGPSTINMLAMSNVQLKQREKASGESAGDVAFHNHLTERRPKNTNGHEGLSQESLENLNLKANPSNVFWVVHKILKYVCLKGDKKEGTYILCQ